MTMAGLIPTLSVSVDPGTEVIDLMPGYTVIPRKYRVTVAAEGWPDVEFACEMVGYWPQCCRLCVKEGSELTAEHLKWLARKWSRILGDSVGVAARSTRRTRA
jgi:hypothetical protein